MTTLSLKVEHFLTIATKENTNVEIFHLQF
jgi:hypothetical protein